MGLYAFKFVGTSPYLRGGVYALNFLGTIICPCTPDLPYYNDYTTFLIKSPRYFDSDT